MSVATELAAVRARVLPVDEHAVCLLETAIPATTSLCWLADELLAKADLTDDEAREPLNRLSLCWQQCAYTDSELELYRRTGCWNDPELDERGHLRSTTQAGARIADLIESLARWDHRGLRADFFDDFAAACEAIYSLKGKIADTWGA